MTRHTMRNGQSVTVIAHQWDGDSLAFAGTNSVLGQTPTVTFTGANTLTSITGIGTTNAAGYATIVLMPGGALIAGGLTINHATLAINERPGTSVTFNGIGQIGNNSTLTATGYAGTGKYTVNGTMNIDGTSTVNMDYVSVAGTGTFHLTGANALLRAGTVGTGETVVLDGGILSLTNGMQFLGTIAGSTPATSRIGPAASVDVYNAMDAVRETFDRTSGVLNLFNAQGTTVASLTFAGTGDLYAAPTSGLATNYVAILSHPSTGVLPATFSS